MGHLDISRMMQSIRVSIRADRMEHSEESNEDFRKLLEEQKEQNAVQDSRNEKEETEVSENSETAIENDSDPKENTEVTEKPVFCQWDSVLQSLLVQESQRITSQPDVQKAANISLQEGQLVLVQGNQNMTDQAGIMAGAEITAGTEPNETAGTLHTETSQKEQGLAAKDFGKSFATETHAGVAELEQKDSHAAEGVLQEGKKAEHSGNQERSHTDLISEGSVQKKPAVRNEEMEGTAAGQQENLEAGQPAVSLPVKAESGNGSVESAKQPVQIHVRQPEEIPQKLTEELLVRTSQGRKEFEIQIMPEHLGKIAVKVLYENGQTTVSILCAEKATHDMVAKNAREIGTVMEQNLGAPTTVVVEKQEADYLEQHTNENAHAGRDSEQERQREQQQKQKAADSEQFLQKLRLGLHI